MYYIYPIDVYFKRFSSKKVGIFFKKYAYFVNSLRSPIRDFSDSKQFFRISSLLQLIQLLKILL